MDWSALPWNWVIPLIVLLVLLLFSIVLACFCKFARKRAPRHEDPKVMLHNIDSVEVIGNPTACATTVFVPAGETVAGGIIEDDEIDLGLATAPKRVPPSSVRAKKSRVDKDGGPAGNPDAFTNPEADISLVPMDLRSSICREYQNPVEMDADVSVTSESAPMIPSKK